MPEKRILLTDIAQEVWVDEFRLSAADGLSLSGSSDWSVAKRTLRGGLSDGVDLVEINNGALSVSVLPTRGMGLWRGEYRGIALGWSSPVAQPVHPKFVNLSERGGLGWLHGFSEWLCRCGLAWNGPPGDDDGTPLTLHGRIANRPAHRVEVSVSSEGPGSLSVMGEVDETSLFGPCLRLTSTVTTEAGSNWLRIHDRVTNLAGRTGELQLLYHLNQGEPLLNEGARVIAPVEELAPRDARAAEGIDSWDRYAGPTAGYTEQVYFARLAASDRGRTLVLLRNAVGDAGLSVRFRREQLPCFSVWKNTQSRADGYCTGLEPATNYPNLKPFERQHGRVVSLAPGGSWEAELEIAVHASADEVRQVEREIETLQRETQPQIHATPQPRLSPVGR